MKVRALSVVKGGGRDMRADVDVRSILRQLSCEHARLRMGTH